MVLFQVTARARQRIEIRKGQCNIEPLVISCLNFTDILDVPIVIVSENGAVKFPNISKTLRVILPHYFRSYIAQISLLLQKCHYYRVKTYQF